MIRSFTVELYHKHRNILFRTNDRLLCMVIHTQGQQKENVNLHKGKPPFETKI